MNRPARLLTSAAAFALALSAQAHPGHDWNDADARHLLTSADHLAVLALLVAAPLLLLVGALLYRSVTLEQAEVRQRIDQLGRGPAHARIEQGKQARRPTADDGQVPQRMSVHGGER